MRDVPAWILLLPSLPSEPSRHRVAVWRELRKLGAAPIGSGAWLLPNSAPFAGGVDRVQAVAVREGGTIAVLDGTPRDATAAETLRAAFARVRIDEWNEFLDECRKFMAEIDKEFAKQKFTLGELEEEEQSLERLKRWFGTLLERDALGLHEAVDAASALARCEARLEEYAERVLDENAGPDGTRPGPAA
ncbi:Chromate resistance protein ChrB [Amnibacterium kyonggiense]